MNSNNKDIEKFILLGYIPKKNRSIEKNLLLTGNWCCFSSTIILILYNVVIFIGDEPFNPLYINMSILILAPLTVFGGIFLSKNDIKFKQNQSINTSQNNHYIKTIIAPLSAVLGLGIARVLFPNISQFLGIVIFSVIIVIIILFCIFIASINYYKVYLIRKFCPYLKNRHL